MKKLVFIMTLFALCLHFNQARAQRYLPGMKGLQVTAGMADGVHWNSNTDFAYHIGAAYSVYTKNANRWVIGGEYLHKKYEYKDMRIPVEQFTAEGGYYLKFLSDRRKTFFLSLGLSALAGYETSNRGDKLLPDGATLSDKDCFIYGGALTLELEAYLTDRVALLLNARERALFGSGYMKNVMYKILVGCYIMASLVLVCACNDGLDIQQAYPFTVETLPVPKKLKVGETAEIRCQLVRGGYYQPTTYQIRYFQPDGKGKLEMDDGTVFLPNDLYPLEKETFRLYYTSASTDQQTIDIYIIDSFGQMQQVSFSFNNDSGEEEEPLP